MHHIEPTPHQMEVGMGALLNYYREQLEKGKPSTTRGANKAVRSAVLEDFVARFADDYLGITACAALEIDIDGPVELSDAEIAQFDHLLSERASLAEIEEFCRSSPKIS